MESRAKPRKFGGNACGNTGERAKGAMHYRAAEPKAGYGCFGFAVELSGFSGARSFS
jgi:hypothetical protein